MRPSSRKLFSPKDDEILKAAVAQVGENWDEVSSLVAKFNARQCKERYTVYLKKAYRTDPWTEDEDNLLLELYEKMGPRWCEISEFFDGRHSNSVKNRWHRYLSKSAARNHGKRISKPKTTKSTTQKKKPNTEPKTVKTEKVQITSDANDDLNDVEQVINSQLLTLNALTDSKIDDVQLDFYNEFLFK